VREGVGGRHEKSQVPSGCSIKEGGCWGRENEKGRFCLKKEGGKKIAGGVKHALELEAKEKPSERNRWND